MTRSSITYNKIINIYGFKIKVSYSKNRYLQFASCSVCKKENSYIFPSPILFDIFDVFEPILNEKGYTLWLRNKWEHKFICRPHCLEKVLKTIPKKDLIFRIGTELSK